MNKIFSIAAALMISLSASADEYSLYYDSTNGTVSEAITTIANLRKITFENGNMVTTLKDGSKKSTPLEDIKKLFFASDPTAISDIAEETVCCRKGVYDLTGRKLAVNINSKQLPKGIYIIDGKKVNIK